MKRIVALMLTVVMLFSAVSVFAKDGDMTHLTDSTKNTTYSKLILNIGKLIEAISDSNNYIIEAQGEKYTFAEYLRVWGDTYKKNKAQVKGKTIGEPQMFGGKPWPAGSTKVNATPYVEPTDELKIKEIVMKNAKTMVVNFTKAVTNNEFAKAVFVVKKDGKVFKFKSSPALTSDKKGVTFTHDKALEAGQYEVTAKNLTKVDLTNTKGVEAQKIVVKITTDAITPYASGDKTFKLEYEGKDQYEKLTLPVTDFVFKAKNLKDDRALLVSSGDPANQFTKVDTKDVKDTKIELTIINKEEPSITDTKTITLADKKVQELKSLTLGAVIPAEGKTVVTKDDAGVKIPLIGKDQDGEAFKFADVAITTATPPYSSSSITSIKDLTFTFTTDFGTGVKIEDNNIVFKAGNPGTQKITVSSIALTIMAQKEVEIKAEKVPVVKTVEIGEVSPLTDKTEINPGDEGLVAKLTVKDQDGVAMQFNKTTSALSAGDDLEVGSPAVKKAEIKFGDKISEVKVNEEGDLTFKAVKAGEETIIIYDKDGIRLTERKVTIKDYPALQELRLLVDEITIEKGKTGTIKIQPIVKGDKVISIEDLANKYGAKIKVSAKADYSTVFEAPYNTNLNTTPVEKNSQTDIEALQTLTATAVGADKGEFYFELFDKNDKKIGDKVTLTVTVK